MSATLHPLFPSYGNDKPRPCNAHAAQCVQGGLIANVEPYSPADDAGIEPGMRILSAEGVALCDRIDWVWHSADLAVEVEIAEDNGDITWVVLERDPGQDWGITFAEELFDGMHLCKNRCTFCFMTMLPQGLRKSLYLKDDDFRLSFSQGNFVTLTNVTDAEVQRIISQHLSPLRVSLHAITPEVRRQLIGPHEHRGIEVLEQLLKAGLQVDTQVVLVPGINDGAELAFTLQYLYDKPGVMSCGIVPLGYTKHQNRFTVSFDDALAAAAVIAQIAGLNAQDPYGGKEQPRFFAADAFYVAAGQELPPAYLYGNFTLFEDGIGMIRATQAEYEALPEDALDLLSQDVTMHFSKMVCLTGVAFAPYLQTCIGSAPAFAPVAQRIQVLPVENVFFGGNVNVTGLLCGTDLVSAITEWQAYQTETRGQSVDEELSDALTLYLIPSCVFNADGLTLDGYTIERLQQESGQQVRMVSCSAEGLAQAAGTFLLR